MSNFNAQPERNTVPLAAFKAYEFRGPVLDELNDEIAYRIGCALVTELGAKSIVVGRYMRRENPMLAQALIRDFAYCDSGMISLLLVTELMSQTSNELAQLVDERIAAFPCSCENNYRDDAQALTQHITNLDAQIQGGR